MTAVVLTLVGLLKVEADPVWLRVVPSSESKQQKEYFDEKFGPFYLTEQIFIPDLGGNVEINSNATSSAIVVGNKPAVLSYDHLKYWFAVEEEIRNLISLNGRCLF